MTLGLDARTLVLVAGGMCMLLPLSIWMILRMPPQFAPLLWCVSNLLGGVGLILMALRGRIDDFLSYGLGNPLLAIGLLGAAQSLRLELGRPMPWRWITWFAFVYAGSTWVLLAVADPKAMVFLAPIFNFVALSALVVSAWQIGREQSSRNAMTIAVAYGVEALCVIVNLLNALKGSSPMRTFASDRVAVAVGLLTLIVVIVASMGYLGLALERMVRRNLALAADMELARQWQERRRTLVALDRERTLMMLAGSLGHALTQPLTAAMLRFQTCIRRIASGAIQPAALLEALEKAGDDIRRTSEIVQRIRNFVRPSEVCHIPLDLVPLLGEVEKLLRQEAINRKIHLVFDLGDAPVWVTADALQLSQAVLQVLHNAMTAATSKKPQWVRLSLRTTNTDARIQVSDSGPGLSMSLLKEPFGADRSFHQSMHGIGLFVVRDIVQQHHGRLELQNSTTAGAIVSIVLPLPPENSCDANGASDSPPSTRMQHQAG